VHRLAANPPARADELGLCMGLGPLHGTWASAWDAYVGDHDIPWIELHAANDASLTYPVGGRRPSWAWNSAPEPEGQGRRLRPLGHRPTIDGGR